jgi:hypothetical protein
MDVQEGGLKLRLARPWVRSSRSIAGVGLGRYADIPPSVTENGHATTCKNEDYLICETLSIHSFAS